MAVLCEGISVIVRRDSIEQYFKGGWAGFLKKIPNRTMCTDEQLVRVGFLSPSDVESYIHELESLGLQFQAKKSPFGMLGESRSTEDIAVVDQERGLTRPCNWLETARIDANDQGGKMLICWLFEGKRPGAFGIHVKGTSMNVHLPEGWTFEKSLSHQFKFVEGLQ